MIKVIGALMITLSCSAIGFSMSYALKRRVSSLNSFISAFQIIQAEIVFKSSKLFEIFATLMLEDIGVASKFFENVHKKMMSERGNSFSLAFSGCIGQLCEIGLTENDVEIIASGARVIGRYESLAQSDILSATVKRLEAERDTAKGYLMQKGRLYRAVGVSTGIMIALIII